MITLVLRCCIIASGILFFGFINASALPFPCRYIPVAALALVSVCVYFFRFRKLAVPLRTPVLLLLALLAEYAFLATFYFPDSVWRIAYLLFTECVHIRLFMLLLEYSQGEEWRMRFAKTYFLLAALNLFNWVLFFRGPGPIFMPWLTPTFNSGWLALVFSVFQLTVYDLMRPKSRQAGEHSSKSRGERFAAWLAYCLSGYREPARKETGNTTTADRDGQEKE